MQVKCFGKELALSNYRSLCVRIFGLKVEKGDGIAISIINTKTCWYFKSDNIFHDAEAWVDVYIVTL